MQFTKLGRSNMSVSRICIGTMHFGSYTPEDEAFRILDRALELGINFIDTANVYGGRGQQGTSEEIIGRWLKQGGRRDQVVLATKVYGNMTTGDQPNEVIGISSYKVRRHAADSLRRLQTDRIDLYQVHHIDRTISLEEFWTTFGRLINNGDVLYMGTSNFPGWGLAKFQMYAWQQGQVGFVSEQPQYNLLNRYPELEVLPAAREFGIGVIPYMPLAGGLLTGKVKSVAGSRTEQVEHEYGMTVNTQQIADYVAFCQEIGESPHVIAIAWTLAHPAVSSAIVGVRTVAHLEGLDRAAELQLAPEQMARLDEIFDISKGRPLRGTEAPFAFSW
ncbi:MAG: aldo/keto reductase [Chloroflexi bacterium]|nr:aldo/keto reductase [Chloroflexota bacterium]